MSLGKKLKEARERMPLTLRQVEEVTGISNAYLSQLENEKIKKPSANILYKLSTLYKISLNSLLAAAGIIEKAEELTGKSKTTSEIAFYAENLSREDEEKVLDFIKFLQFNRKKN